MATSKAEDRLDDLDHYVNDRAWRLGLELGWRTVLPLVEAARASTDAQAFIDERLAEMVRAKAA